MNAKDLRQAEYFGNRLAKNERRLRKWTRREGIFALRLYDNDIPEVPLVVELFRQVYPLDRESPPQDCLVIALYERPYEKDPAEEETWLGSMAKAASASLGVPMDGVFLRRRKRQRGLAQYERSGRATVEGKVLEGGLSYIVNFTDYLDTGLFLDHRPTRALVRSESAGRRVLNLFSYTGSFSVCAAAGGALEVTSVDLSNTYLSWASRNMALNALDGPSTRFVRSDVRAFLDEARRAAREWDIVVCDPPTFSNSSSTTRDFDVNRDWPDLVASCLAVLSPDGALLFSSNSRRLKWDDTLVKGDVADISEACLPPDFRDRRIRRTWRIQPSRGPSV